MPRRRLALGLAPRPALRPALALAGSLAAAAALCTHAPLAVYASVAGVAALGGALAALGRPWAALAGRGLLWTSLAFATLFTSFGDASWTLTAAALALCGALAALGRHGLDDPGAAFQPSHHRGPLTLALVLGFADVATLTWWTAIAASDGSAPALRCAVGFGAIAALIAASLVGLYRLRTWGFLLNLTVNLAVVGLMAVDAFRLSIGRLVFVVPAVAQLALATPVLIAIVRRRPLAWPAPLARLGAAIPAITIAVMAALNVQPWFGEPALRVLVRRLAGG